MGEIWAEPLIYRFCFSIRRLAHLVSKMAYSGRFCPFSCALGDVCARGDIATWVPHFPCFLANPGRFSPPIWSEPSAGNHNHTIALLASPLTLATQDVVVLPAGLGIDKQSPLSLASFRHSWHNKLLSGLNTEIMWQHIKQKIPGATNG